MRSLYILPILSLGVGVPGCTKNVDIPESTTTDVRSDRQVIAISADGMLQLIIPAGAVAEETALTITTRRDMQASGLAGLIYEIAPADLAFAQAAELRIRIPATETFPDFTIAAISNGTVHRFTEAVYSANEGFVRASLTALEYPYYAAITRFGCSGAACSDGWEDMPGTGRFFIINSLAVAGQGQGFDLDQACDGAMCVDNALWQLGALIDGQISDGMMEGNWLELIELAGLEAPYAGDDAAVTVKAYHAEDADALPVNDFQGGEGCCRFAIAQASLASVPPQARRRWPAEIAGESLQTTWINRLTVPFWRPLFVTLSLERARMSMRVPSSLDRIESGLLGGVMAINTLAASWDPFCRNVSASCPQPLFGSTMLDFVTALVRPQPDIDLDGDGLEQVLDTDGDGRIDACFDGCVGACAAPEAVPPLLPEDPTTCAWSPRMADGYSISFTFTAVAATATGVSWRSIWPNRGQLFPPLRGIVYGHVEKDEMGGGFSHIRVHNIVSGDVVFAHAADDGDYHFAIPGVSADYLQISPADGAGGAIEDAAFSLEVPPYGPPGQNFVCCMAAGTCWSELERERGGACPDLASGAVACATDNDCAVLNGINVSPAACGIEVRDSPLGLRVVAGSGLCPEQLPPGWLIEARNGDSVGYDVTDAGSRFLVWVQGQSGDPVTLTIRRPTGQQTSITVP